jgi:hypothetical protein
LQTGSEVRRFAHHRLLLGGARAEQAAHNDQPGRDADADVKRIGYGQSSDCIDKHQPGSNSPLRIILVGVRIAEIDQHTIAHVLGDKPSKRVPVSPTQR